MTYRISMQIYLLLTVLLASSSSHSVPQKISQVEVSRSGFFYNRLTDTYDATVTIRNISTLPLAAPMRLVLESVIPNSVSLYNIYGRTAQGKPYVEVPLAGYVLSPGRRVAVPVRFVKPGRAVIGATFSIQAIPLEPSNTVRLTIIARMNADNGGGPVGAGFSVKLDGVTRAVTDAHGRATIVAPLSASEISVSKPPNYYGATQVAGLRAAGTRTVEVEVGDSGEFGADSRLRMDRLQHLMLPMNVPMVVLRFIQDEKAVVTDLVELIELQDPAGGPPKDITALFTKRSDGSLAANTSSFIASIGNLNGKKLIFAQVLDKNGVPHLGELSFYVARHIVKGKLTAPPSNPTLALGGIPIEISMLNTDIVFQTESAADGTFTLPFLPSGILLIKAATTSAGVFYSGQGTVSISGNIRVELKMRAQPT